MSGDARRRLRCASEIGHLIRRAGGLLEDIARGIEWHQAEAEAIAIRDAAALACQAVMAEGWLESQHEDTARVPRV